MKGLETGLGAAAIQTCPSGRAGRVGGRIFLQVRARRESKICIDRFVPVFCRLKGINPEESSQSRRHRERLAGLAQLAGSEKFGCLSGN
jgi:hypothetical protein